MACSLSLNLPAEHLLHPHLPDKFPVMILQLIALEVLDMLKLRRMDLRQSRMEVSMSLFELAQLDTDADKEER